MTNLERTDQLLSGSPVTNKLKGQIENKKKKQRFFSAQS